MSDVPLNKLHNVAKLKTDNRYIILDCLRHIRLSRAELSRMTGLAKSSVTTITNEMISQGILCEAGLAEKSNKAGRTRVLLEINGDFGFAAGINLHRKRISAAVTDISGEIIFDFYAYPADFSSTEEAVSCIIEELNRKIKENGLDTSRMVGIGVSSPGPLDYEKGIILEPPNFPLFNNFAIVRYLESEYGCPVFLENNAVASALFEHYYVSRQEGSTLFVTVSDGIGGALLQNGKIYRGSHGAAGELGHISVDPEGELCECGNRGCLEQYATLSALKNRFGFESYNEIADLFGNGDSKAEKVIEFLVNTLSGALVGAVNLFDLDRIILYGEYNYKCEILTERIEKYINTHSVICKAHRVEVVPSGQSPECASAAAAVPALNNFFRYNTTH